MPHLKDYHILISHSWDYASQYNTVKGWLDDSLYFTWTNYSVPLEHPLNVNRVRELEGKLRDRIRLCSCVIVLSGMYVDYSKWIDFEIDTAVTMNKPIIGIRPWGQERVPKKVWDCANTLVGWNSSSVVNAVRGYAL